MNLKSPCYLGYPAHTTNHDVFDEYAIESDLAKVQPVVSEWLYEHAWPERYTQWQRSLRCNSGFANSEHYGDSEYCSQLPKPSGLASDLNNQRNSLAMCSSKAASLSYLTMHRYLLQSVRALWPDLENHFGSWMMLPQQEDFPGNMQPLFHAWPDKVQRDAMLLSSIKKMSDQELFTRWPSESDFVHWMLCGSDKPGMSVDSLYGTLTSNMLRSVDPSSFHQSALLDQYLFWKTHAWFEMQWNMYRMRMDLMPVEPELQADIIAQCEIFASFTALPTTQNKHNIEPSTPFFENGRFNVDNIGKRFRLLGQVQEILPLNNGVRIYRLELPLLGVAPVWTSSYIPLKQSEVSVGENYIFTGYLTSSEQLDTSGKLRKKLDSNTVLMAFSIQSPK